MHTHEVREFLDEVCLEVKYRAARKKVRSELKDHLEDHANRLIDKGYDSDEAYKRAVKAMGSGSEIGKELNKEHRPYLGWLVSMTNVIISIFGAYFVYMIISLIIVSISSNYEYDHSINDEDIEYACELDDEVTFDNKKFELLKFVKLKNNNIVIFYKITSTNPFALGWGSHSFSYFDNNQVEYHGGSGTSFMFNGELNYAQLDNVPNDISFIIMEYDWYNRYVKFEIDLDALKEEVDYVENK